MKVFPKKNKNQMDTKVLFAPARRKYPTHLAL